MDTLPEKCGGCDSTNLRETPGDRPLMWILRLCPVCGYAKVVHYEHEYTICEGPHCGPFQTDRTHMPVPTIAVHVTQDGGMVDPEADGLPFRGTYPGWEWCHVHTDRPAVVKLPETGEPLCQQCQYEYYWRPSQRRVGAWIG
jgi:hypothetical protein